MNEQSKITAAPGEELRDPHPHDENVVDLISKLTRQGAHLAEEQVSLMQAEVRETAHDTKQAVGAYAGAAVVGIAGLGVTLMGLAYLVSEWVESLWGGTLIVGVLTLVIAAILYSSGKSKISATSLKPERSIRTAEDTPDAVTGNMSTKRRTL
ncbi:phage holin family protein [Qipengyuania sp. DY56-A-20]|jgi:hypothetical protein|uniref:Phage holin family protein n=1 Tax=Qipengyuania benthica TaxID=3067651 RepID=A0ABT9H5B0_9SPHN|nr:phage holin family protein [Qipengyuania sp. DY56-A-20]MDP4538497.1 phage holin family protein [Qipengyuania sp. DY56-A-20]